jgi:hypothetical protein
MHISFSFHFEGNSMEDFTALNAIVTKLTTDTAALIATKTANNQAAIDAATAALTTLDGTVTAATPAPATPPATGV